MTVEKLPLEISLMSYFEEAYGALVMASTFAHLENHPEAENISKLINTLEDIECRVSGNKPTHEDSCTII